MTGAQHFFIILSVIAVDILGNWYYIEKLNKRPNHPLLWITRALIVSFVVLDTELIYWALKAINASFMYWFIFDTGLNIARGKRIDHLGDAFLDGLQVKYLGYWNAFVIKLILSIYAAANMLYNYNPY